MKMAAACRLLLSQAYSRGLVFRPVQTYCCSARFISTSGKNKDISATISEAFKGKKIEGDIPDEEELQRLKQERRNWITYGFDYDNEAEDVLAFRMVFFSTITLVFCVGGFVMMYQPDARMRNWAVREACLELHRREKEGLPLIDADLVPQSKMCLPSDEELGDTEIII